MISEKKKILIVDDSAVSVRLFTALLEGPEYDVYAVNNGRDALVSCAQARPDLILLDLHLPDMDGFEVTRHLKRDQATCGIPIVAVTAYGHGQASDAAMEAGVDEFIAKPFSGVALRETVASFVKRPS